MSPHNTFYKSGSYAIYNNIINHADLLGPSILVPTYALPCAYIQTASQPVVWQSSGSVEESNRNIEMMSHGDTSAPREKGSLAILKFWKTRSRF
jgi:hypothetical protein